MGALILMLKREHKVFVIHKHTNNQLGIWALIKRSRPINLITGPIIYAMIFPIALLDLFVWFYQLTCFPVYKLEKLKRADYIFFDRQELKYLDWASKFHCTYCAYAVGVINLVAGIINATESYFCPIKHKLKNKHRSKRRNYINYENDDEYDFDEKLESIRKKITIKKL